ncbi:MAG: transketolase C-terminal domain-containing protein [Candidatus Bipolaricaulota bacterium]
MPAKTEATRKAFGAALAEAGARDERIVVLTADLGGSTRAGVFGEEFPGRFFNVGVAEANMMGIAAGMAMSGLRPFATTFSVFATGKAWEQVRQVIAYPSIPVRIVASHAGLTVGEDGASHQMLEDISNMRVLPHMSVIVPADGPEATAATHFLAGYDESPVYMRLARAAFPVVHEGEPTFSFGKLDNLAEGSDVVLFACGIMVSRALEARETLATEGISAAVVNVSTIKPLDVDGVLAWAQRCGCAVAAEEHQGMGGLSSALAEVLSEHHPVPLARVAMQDVFGQSGPAEELLTHYGLTAHGVAEGARKVLKAKS